MPSKKVAWIEGETLAKQLINRLADEIADAALPDGVENRWVKVYETPFDKWVTYTQTANANVQGRYLHEDGKLYNVYKAKDLTGLKSRGTGVDLVDDDGFVHETSSNSNAKTGRKFQVVDISYTDEAGNLFVLPIPGLLLANVDDPNSLIGKKAVVVEQGKFELDGTFTPDANWNEFRYLCDMSDDWNYVLTRTNETVQTYYEGYPYYYDTMADAADLYKFSERTYVPNPVHFVESTVVLQATPDVPEGKEPQDYYVMFRQPKGQYNYFDVCYGQGFTGTNPSGRSAFTYEGACLPSSVVPGAVPTITDMKKVEEIYRTYNDPTFADRYVPPTMTWAKDIDGVTELKSPPAHFFYGADSVVPWLTHKKRREDYWVGYWISINNDRVALVIEGDPAPDMDGYYRSFGYLGKIVPFADYDHDGNFGVTVGMGDLTVEKSSFVLENIKQDTNPTYSGFGRYTSNGMYSFSMLRTRSNVLYQAYYPAFITQLPNYKGSGTVPKDLSKLVLEKTGYQPSAWTEKYHASPVYLVHQFEGYRGYLEGLVAINDHNLINRDELVVDTEEAKDPMDASKGNWTEVYKFFSLKSPVNFFKYSANPDECTIAILKEVK